MADQELREVFNDCIDRMAAGQSISDCLRYYPEYAAVLRPMLETTSLVERVQANSYEIAAAQVRVRARVSAHLQERSIRQQRSYGRFVTLAASLLIAFVALFGAAETSLPGDLLYNVKRFTEGARSTLIGQQFTGRRLDEIRGLEALKRPEDVTFSGQVEQSDGAHWRVAGLDVQVAPGTPGAESAVVGDTVRVTAQTTPQGDLVASKVIVLVKRVMPLLATATVTPPVATTPTSLPSETPIPSPTVCTPTMPAGWLRYVVQPSDTIAELATLTGVTTQALITVNCVPPTQMIIVGQTLFLPMLPPSRATLPSVATLPPSEPTQPLAGSTDQPNPQPTDVHPDNGEDGTGQHTGGDG